MDTDRLVGQLAADLTPVRRIAPPGARLGAWLLVSLPAAAVVAWASGLRPDLAARLSDPSFLLEEAAALLTGLIAAYAALCACLPNEPGWKLWLPLAPMALWLATLGYQSLDLFLRFGPQGLQITSDPMCLRAVALGGLGPAIAMVVLLRRGRGVRVTHACLCGALAAAVLGAVALRLYHTEDAAIMVLVWQFGSVVFWTVVAGVISRLLVVAPANGFVSARR